MFRTKASTGNLGNVVKIGPLRLFIVEFLYVLGSLHTVEPFEVKISTEGR